MQLRCLILRCLIQMQLRCLKPRQTPQLMQMQLRCLILRCLIHTCIRQLWQSRTKSRDPTRISMSPVASVCVCARARACVRACVRVCVRACVCVRAHVCVWFCLSWLMTRVLSEKFNRDRKCGQSGGRGGPRIDGADSPSLPRPSLSDSLRVSWK